MFWPVIHLPSPIPVQILMSVLGQGGRSFWIFRHLPSPKWQTAVQGVQAPGTQVVSQFSWTFWLTTLSTWNISLHSPCCLLLPIYELQITFFWTREAPAFAHVRACSHPKLFTSLVYRRVDNTAFLCLHGSFMLWPSLFCLSQWRYWLDDGSGSVFTYLFTFLWISVYGVYVGTASYTWWWTGVRSQPFEREFSPSTLFLEGGPLWVIGSLCDILYPADVWTSGWFSCLLPISPLEYGDYRCTPVGSRVWTQVSRLV